MGTIALAALVSACDDFDANVISIPSNTPNAFIVTRLVADDAAGNAASIDPDLVNPWGLAFNPTGILWSANNGTGTATLYSATGVKQPLVVQIPSDVAATGGRPTGLIFNPTTDFAIAGTGPSLFIFVGEDGVISAWNVAAGTSAVRVANRAANGSVYKAVAMASNGGVNFLYATDFHNNAIDVFDANFGFVRSFTDPTIPAGFAPFGIQNIAGKLFVTYAKQQPPDNEDDQAGVGNGFVDVFNPDGTVARRFASNGSLNSPWGIAVAPAGFGPFAGTILIGNFGDGKIGVYDANTGGFIDFLKDGSGTPITLDGLWSLVFGPASGSTTLFFSSGPGDETHGLLGTITPP